MKRKQPVYKGLNKVPVYHVDQSVLSPELFVITEFPKQLTAGKNLIKLRGNFDTLKHYSKIEIEILDSNGQPVYHEITNFVDTDKSRVISIYIYKNTPAGLATITLLTEAIIVNKKSVPDEWKNKLNVKWVGTIQINPTTENISEIIFDILPGVQISEQIGVQLNRQYNISQYPTYSSGSVQYRSINNQPVLLISGGEFNTNMTGGTITVPNPVNPKPLPSYSYITSSYITTIKKVLNKNSVVLDTEYLLPTTNSIIPHYYNQFELSPYIIEYEEKPQYLATENSESFALIKINNLQPSTGDVSRLKVFVNNIGTIGTWEQITDIELPETEIFVTNTASLNPDTPIGFIRSQSDIDTYYKTGSYVGKTISTAPTVTFNTSSLMNSMFIQSNIGLEIKSAVTIVQISSSYAGYFIEDASYKVIVDAFTENKNGLISVYVSGSAFKNDITDYFNRELPTKVGKRIGEIDVSKLGGRIDDYEISFIADQTGDGVLIFVIEEGDWYLSDIRTKSDNELGYTPNYTRIKSFVPTSHKSDVQLSFKLEYYNKDGVKCRQTSYVTNVPWQGGNRYIDGDYSMLTGSLYVADSLNSGIAISGYSNSGFVRSLGYDGFNAGAPGFLLWSGSAMQGSTTTYNGVGLELYANANNYFRYRTSPSELIVKTENFFLGSTSPNNFISGSAGKLQISSSAFNLNPNGSVTASSFTAVSGGLVLFDTNNKYADAFNIGRIVYFDKNESTISDLSTTTSEATAQTASLFQTFILPGETAIGVSFTYKHINTSANTINIRYHAYIASSSLDAVTGTTGYGTFSTPERITVSDGLAPGSSAATNTTKSGAVNINLISSTNNVLSKYWGKYVQIYLTAYGSGISPAGSLNLKNFVFKSSRVLASITASYDSMFPPLPDPTPIFPDAPSE